ncbi:MAG: hypothetical protein ABJN69_06965 [Hellea sp.]
MQKLVPILFYALALIVHGVPAMSVFAPSRMAKLYGISADDQVLMTLLQHRAVLFALVAAACIYAAHVVSARWPVLIGTVISMAAFILIAVPRGQLSGSLAKITYVDGLGLVIAVLLAFLMLRT